MKNLVIIAAGGCGREVLQWVKDINEAGNIPRWHIKGFIDDNLAALDNLICDAEILSAIDSYEIDPDDEFVCCIGNSRIRKGVIESLKQRGAEFVTIIHPTAVVADSSRMGEAVIVYPYALISDNAVVHDGCIINMYSSVAHDSVLGEYCTISAHCDVTGMCTLGDRVFMGSGSNIVPGTKIGNDVFICAGSTVMTNLKDGIKVFGTPAKKAVF